MEVQVAWDPTVTEALRLYYQTRQQDGWHRVGTNETPAFPQPRKIQIPVTDDQADAGHATRSRWRFRLEAYGNPTGQLPGLVSVADGDVDVEVRAHRASGELPLEPAHPDLYNGTSIYQIGRVEAEPGPILQAGSVVASDAGVDLGADGVDWLIVPGHEGVREGELPGDPIDAEHVVEAVPTGTKTLLAQVHVEGDFVPGAEPAVCLVGTQERVQPRASLDELECRDIWEDGTVRFTKPLTHHETDHVYTTLDGYRTKWLLGLRIRGQAGYWQPSLTASQIDRVSMCLFASEDVDPAVPSWAGC